MKKELLIKVLNRLKSDHERISKLREFGIDLTEFNDGLINILEETICLLISEEKFDSNLDLIQWWLYDQPNKVFYYDDRPDVDVDVNKVEDFVQYLLDN
jgi:hypothetical protein